MKLTLFEMQQFYKDVDNAENVQRNEDGQVIAFTYKKYYGKTTRSGRNIKVSLKSNKALARAAAIYLHEKDFFNQLAENINDVEKVKLHCEKIYRYELNGLKYKTDKTDTKKLFDFLPYKDFLRVTRSRFWNNDGLLRNGYFSGLIGTFNDGILKYKHNPDDYILYDVDFNAAYPYCFKMPLPYGKFYSADEWEKISGEHDLPIKFYYIKIKNIDNPFNVFIAPPPFYEYRDFDFLLPKTNSNMIVSEHRLRLINKVYGKDTYIIKKEYYCATKIYVKLSKFAQQLYDDIQSAKAANDEAAAHDLKIALNSLVGNFGRRDESRSIDKLRLIDNDIIAVNWTESEPKRQNNYLPLALAINDITARRLFDMMTDTNALRLCYNTDGGIIGIKKGCRIVTSSKMGRLKAKRLHMPLFYNASIIYNRPLIYDALKDKCYNARAVRYCERTDNFYYTEKVSMNTRNGFKVVDSEFVIVAEDWQPFNFRQSEILIKIEGSAEYKKLLKPAKNDLEQHILKESAQLLDRLFYPFDDAYGHVRRADVDADDTEYEQMRFKESFFKTGKKS